MDDAIAYADAMRAKADLWTIKRVARVDSQIRAGGQKVERWQALELTKHMVGKLRVREMFKTWQLAWHLAAREHRINELQSEHDELEKEHDELQAKYVELQGNYMYMMGEKATVGELAALKSKYLGALESWKIEKNKREALEKELELTKLQLGEKIINNPRGINKKALKASVSSKTVPPASPRRKATREDDPRGVRTTPSKKGGWGAPLAGAGAGLIPSPAVATTTRARTQFGEEGLRDLTKEFVGS